MKLFNWFLCIQEVEYSYWLDIKFSFWLNSVLLKVISSVIELRGIICSYYGCVAYLSIGNIADWGHSVRANHTGIRLELFIGAGLEKFDANYLSVSCMFCINFTITDKF